MAYIDLHSLVHKSTHRDYVRESPSTQRQRRPKRPRDGVTTTGMGIVAGVMEA